MSELEQNKPDDFWRQAFQEAAETPPPRVWDAVERRLDESDNPRVVPLWRFDLNAGRSWTWAAGVAAAVVVVLIGWWAVPSSPQTQLHSAAPVAQTSPFKSDSVALGRSSGQSPVASVHHDRPGRSAKPITAPTNPLSALAFNRLIPVTKRESVALADKTIDQQGGQSSVRTGPALTGSPAQISVVSVPSPLSPAMATDQLLRQPIAQAESTSATQSVAAAQPATAPDPIVPPVAKAVVAQAAVAPAARHESGLAVPMGDLAPAESEAVQPKRKPREVWASLSLMPGAFNPVVTLRSASAASVASAYATTKSGANPSVVSSRADFSVAYAATTGVQLTERWSVESGVGYLAGRSTVDSPVSGSVYTNQLGAAGRNVPANGSGTLFVDALRNQVLIHNAATTNSIGSADGLLNNYQLANSYTNINVSRQALTNEYQYVQVPVQLEYQLRPRKRLNLALLGGLLTNIFVRNTVGDALTLTAKDGVYRPIFWAATVGARFRYRPSRRWSASLAGLYQPSLGAGTRPESLVQSHPTSVGMRFGVDYHF